MKLERRKVVAAIVGVELRWFPIFNENFTSHEHTNEEERRVSEWMREITCRLYPLHLCSFVSVLVLEGVACRANSGSALFTNSL
jgi:hypothetical protein